jgi:hypothetical protein
MFLPVFDPQKCFNPLLSPVLSRFISGDYFLFNKLKIKLKGLHFADVATIQVAVTNELKRVQKEEFSAGFQKEYGCAKACIYANGAYIEFKKECVFLICHRLKKSVLKLFNRTV